MTALSRKLGAYSVAAGAAVVGVSTVAQGALVVFDHSSSPLPTNVHDTYSEIDEEMAVLYMDGTYKYATYAGSYTYYDQNGVTTPIVAGDLTTDSVWFGNHDFESTGAKNPSGYTGVFIDPGDGGIVGTSITGNQSGNPLNVVTQLFDGDVVNSSLSFETDAGAVVRGVGGRYPPGWGGNTTATIGFSGDGYVGFYLDELDGRHYGWVEVTLPGWASPHTVTIHRWAYQTTPEVGAMVPEPMTLSLLALGASGLLAHRSKIRQGGRK